MALRPKDGETENFPLILVEGNVSVHDRRMVQHYARALAARVNRRKHRDDLKISRSKSVNTELWEEVSKSKVISLAAKRSNDTKRLDIRRPTSDRAHYWPTINTSIPRWLAPVFSGLHVSSFDPAVTPEAARVADFYLNVVYPGRLPRNEAWLRFQAFCEHRVIYHVFHYGAAAYQNLSNHRKDLSIRNDMLRHKSQSIHELNALLTKLAPENIEIAILAVLFLGTSAIHRATMSSLLPLFPHLPYAKWIGVGGRMKFVAAHANALEVLIDRQGNVHELQMPGLAFNITRLDLRYASLSLSHPKFVFNWPIEAGVLTRCQALQSVVASSNQLDLF